MQGYVRSGNLSFAKRIRDGIWDNILFYSICGGVGLIVVIYAIFGLHLSPEYLLTLVIPLANAYGLALLTLLMGYGLVEFPRGIWYHSDTKWLLSFIESSLPGLKESTIDTEAEIYEVSELVAAASRRIPSNDSLRPMVDKLMELCPP